MQRKRRVPFAIWVTLWAIIVVAALALIITVVAWFAIHELLSDRRAAQGWRHHQIGKVRHDLGSKKRDGGRQDDG